MEKMEKNVTKIKIEKQTKKIGVAKKPMAEAAMCSKRSKSDPTVKKKIISILKAWGGSSGNSSKSENAGEYSGRGNSQLSEMLSCAERGDWKGASETYRGACSDFWDAGYDWDDTCGGYTLRELDATVSAIRAIAEGKKVSKNFMKD